MTRRSLLVRRMAMRETRRRRPAVVDSDHDGGVDAAPQLITPDAWKVGVEADPA